MTTYGQNFEDMKSLGVEAAKVGIQWHKFKSVDKRLKIE